MRVDSGGVGPKCYPLPVILRQRIEDGELSPHHSPPARLEFGSLYGGVNRTAAREPLRVRVSVVAGWKVAALGRNSLLGLTPEDSLALRRWHIEKTATFFEPLITSP
jgi:hypothetical protein